MEELLTVEQVSRALKVSKMTIYRYIKSGRLTAYKAGRDFRVKKSHFNNFLEKNRSK